MKVTVWLPPAGTDVGPASSRMPGMSSARSSGSRFSTFTVTGSPSFTSRTGAGIWASTPASVQAPAGGFFAKPQIGSVVASGSVTVPAFAHRSMLTAAARARRCLARLCFFFPWATLP